MHIIIDLFGDDDLVAENESKKKKEEQKILPISSEQKHLRKQVININGKIVEI